MQASMSCAHLRGNKMVENLFARRIWYNKLGTLLFGWVHGAG